MTQLDQRYATRTVPRYTSYPTAPHFHAGIDAAVYGRWLDGIDAATPLSLYLHVPYCRTICTYCGCHTKGARKDEPVIAYADTLLREIDLVADRLAGPSGLRRPVVHIHWGGGTPSLLPRDNLLALAERLRTRFDFTPEIEHAIELDPRTVTPELADTLATIGITRASLGVQDFDPVVQKAIGRIQPFEQVERSVALLRGVGITALNFDLMYGLPHQSIATIDETVRLTRELAPGRIALFGYAHVPWFKKHQRLIKEADLPGVEERIALADSARAALREAGYTAIGLDHFALPDDSMAIALAAGTLRRNFQGYTTDTADTLIGLGCSSIGRLPQGYCQNQPDIGGWRRSIEAGELPVAKGIALDDDDRARADIIERLMTDHEADVLAIAKRFGFPPSHFDTSIDALADMIADGLATYDGGVVRITETGQRYARVAAAAFDAYLAAGAARHSIAV